MSQLRGGLEPGVVQSYEWGAKAGWELVVERPLQFLLVVLPPNLYVAVRTTRSSHARISRRLLLD